MGVLLALAAGMFFGLSNITVRRAQLQGRVDQFTGLFVGVAVNNGLNLLLLAGFVLFGAPFPPLNLPASLYFGASGLLTSFLGRELLFKSIRRIGPSRAAALKISAPVFTVLLGVLVLQEKIALPAFFGIALILAATYFISLELLRIHKASGEDPDPAVSAPPRDGSYRRGMVGAVLAGLALGAGNVFRKLGVIHYASPLPGVSISSFAALLFMLALLARQGRLNEALRDFPALLRGGYFWTGVLTSLALYATFTALLYAPVSIVNSIKAAEPLFTIAGSYILLHSLEAISVRFIGLTLLVIAGVAVVAYFS
jgi:drug/metabolite transporter (DMT)-like permease